MPTGWAAFVGSTLHGVVRSRWGERLAGQREAGILQLAALTAANATMHTASIPLAGVAFHLLGGLTPLASVNVRTLIPLVALSLTDLGTNYLVGGLFLALRGRAPLRLYSRLLPKVLVYEGVPPVFAPLMAIIYTRLGLVLFTLFALALGLSSIMSRGLALARRRLERRVQELDGLQAVGQALSASLRVETVLSGIYEQVARLMSAQNFYVALYDPQTDEVSFPLTIEDGQRVLWRSRRAGNWLTEYLLRTRQPLLIFAFRTS